MSLEERLKKEYKKKNAWGLSSSYDLHDCNPETIKDAKKIRYFVGELCEKLGVTRYGPCRLADFGEREEVAGYSMTQLIETSLISAHFVNLTNQVFLDVFSCSYYNTKQLLILQKNFLKQKI